MKRHSASVVKALACVLVIIAAVALPAPASATPTHRPSALATMADDFRTDCEAHPAEAASLRGWARSRFELCHHYDRSLNLYRDTGEYLGRVEYDLWVLGFAYDGSRRVDYLASLENVGISQQLNAEIGYLTVTMSGCQTSNVTCSGATSRSDNIPGWFGVPHMASISATSPNDTGAPPYQTVDLLAQFEVLVEYRDGRTIPYSENSALSSVRFDSARTALGNGKYHGTVFTDYVPTLELSMRAGSDHLQEARHVRDALQYPERTFPSRIGKSVPGGSADRPLHRLMDSTLRGRNHSASVEICGDVWGTDYTTGGLQCDEYPFQSTYEGSWTSTIGEGASDTSLWQGSARPIDGTHNQQGGTHLANFYGANRLLDRDAFLVTVLT
ncbi:hypothetical protein QTQ03_27485 [Micromonospora sp. WMMA1363]|uniref:NucA/NucB deoxyribonuclease domain-containing protein n=1 Tax=Micromonospora sp. WMMA1363 TaxID=3053985 RepID=UPI00259CB18D|nr:hypothetical protein [Micromonospora sp. WMMA1363]MDM4723162.1 hypothetical protein [Micromonospora sp. WMMA1363]